MNVQTDGEYVAELLTEWASEGFDAMGVNTGNLYPCHESDIPMGACGEYHYLNLRMTFWVALEIVRSRKLDAVVDAVDDAMWADRLYDCLHSGDGRGDCDIDGVTDYRFDWDCLTDH